MKTVSSVRAVDLAAGLLAPSDSTPCSLCDSADFETGVREWFRDLSRREKGDVIMESSRIQPPDALERARSRDLQAGLSVPAKCA